MSRIGTVYRVTNRVNGMQYIGGTVSELATRWSQHVSYARTASTPLQVAIREFGRDAFDIESIATCFGERALRETEAQLTLLLGTLEPNGYNVSIGTKHGRKTLERFKGRVPWQKGKPSPNRGKPRPDEVRAKISAALSGRTPDPRVVEKMRKTKAGVPLLDKRKPLVDQNGRIYESLTAAADAIGCHISAVSMALSGKRKTVKGLTLRFLKE